MTRHLASIKKIDKVDAIEGADRIEVATIGGWKVVIGKGEFSEGDKCVYFEIDSCLPTSDPKFAFLAKRSEKTWLKVEDEENPAAAPVEVTGHVLRTAKFRGQVSQGLVMPLDACGLDPDLDLGEDVTEILGVIKYDPYIPGNMTRVGGYPDHLAIRSDCERVQNLSECWDEIKGHAWYATTKVDGQSTSVWIDRDGNLHWAGRNQENKWDVGDPHVACAIEAGLVECLVPGMLIQFEFAGPKVQSNRLSLEKPTPFVFCVWQDRKQLARGVWPTSCLDATVPVLDFELPDTVEECIEQANGLRGTVSKDRLDEGIVWHTVGGEGLECLDGRDCFKAISNKYLLKNES